ncbi:hypothetical protein CGCA056_v013891 [Colletotrichum aenigma]|uniref:uncharacterized protein n=1 Tax=Colletotrichum aenigma TaxID=1215731 RepID=UPI001872C3CC|nr:uncharacterized protein CGCA056_v013891 [Colletotrichum aenigma]KAF5502440.1 hypothetical protein CGCA056_v013891 [Colletotrichum aenigma]
MRRIQGRLPATNIVLAEEQDAEDQKEDPLAMSLSTSRRRQTSPMLLSITSKLLPIFPTQQQPRSP